MIHRQHPRRPGNRPGMFVVGGQAPPPEEVRDFLAQPEAPLLVPPVGLDLSDTDAVAAAILWDQTAAAEPYQVDLTRTLEDTTRMGNSLSAAVRLELLSEDYRAQLRDERSAAERTADELAAAEAECAEHVPMLDGRCALCGARVDPVTGGQLDDDGLPVAEDVWDQTGELPLTVADLHAELAPRTYAAPRPVAPADPAVPMSAEQSRSTGGAAARILNWSSRHDERSLGYGIRAALPGPAPLVDREWPHGPILDQGTAPPLSLHDASGCTGHAGINAANILELARPDGRDRANAWEYGHEDAMRLYELAQDRDDVPGASYPGTSVLALMKAGTELGLWASYRWGFGTRDVAQALLQVGPVVIGIPWLSGMADPGPDGVITVAGDEIGGHALCLHAIRMTLGGRAGPWFGALQTWGESVGDRGVIWFHHKDLARLLHAVGEAAIPLGPGQ